MRPFLAVAVWVVILGGLFVYSRARHLIVPAPEPAKTIKPLPGKFSLELTPTYDVPAGDDFATEASNKSDPIVLKLNGHEIFRRSTPAPGGIPIPITWDTELSPVNEGENEFFVSANPSDATYLGAPAVRVQLLRDGEEVAEETLWGGEGHRVEGRVYLVFPEYMQTPQSHEH